MKLVVESLYLSQQRGIFWTNIGNPVSVLTDEDILHVGIVTELTIGDRIKLRKEDGEIITIKLSEVKCVTVSTMTKI